MTGAACFAEMVSGYGASHVFFVPTFMNRAYAELESLGVVPVSTHGEKAAAYMADGYARVSQRPGICMAQMIGASNLAAGLKDARMVGAPVIALTGGTYPETEFRHVYQENRDHLMFDAVTKWAARVESVERLPEFVRQAFRAATTGSPGPVHLEVRGHLGEIGDREADLDPYVEQRFDRAPAFRPAADADAIDDALELLYAAERPVIVAGAGVVRSRAERELVLLAEALAIPVASSLNAKATIPDDHRLAIGTVGTYGRRCANDLLREADLVFFVGTQVGSMVTNNWTLLAPEVKVVHLDIDGAQLGRVYRTDVALMGDAQVTLAQMRSVARPVVARRWTAHAEVAVSQWRENNDDLAEADAVPIRPERICRELQNALPAGAAVITDTLQSSQWAGLFLGLSRPGQRFARCAGSLGWGLPAAIGAKCALGDQPVVCFTGDGGLYYHVAELETAARYGIPVVVVVNNNNRYAGEADYWEAAYAGHDGKHRDDLWIFDDIDFAKIAKGFGCDATRISRPEDLRPAIDKALAASRPTLIDVVSDASAIADKGWS